MDDSVFIALALTAAVLLPALRPVRDDTVDRWALRFGMEDLAEAREEIRNNLGISRRTRAVAMVIGLNLGALPSYIGKGDSPVTDVMIGLGALAGAAMSAWFLSRGRGRGIAAVSPRRWDDYVPRNLVKVQAGTVVAALIGLALAFATSRNRGEAITGVVASATAAVALVSTMRLIVGASPGRAGIRNPPMDFARRTYAAHQLLGSTLGLSILGAALCLQAALPVDSTQWVVVVGAFIAFITWGWLTFDRPTGNWEPAAT